MLSTDLREAFGDRPFSAREVALVLGVRSPESALSRLKTRGLVETVSRGTYRVAEPGRAREMEERRRAELRRAIVAAPFRVALDGPDAVAWWTRGRYVVGRTVWNDPLYLAVEAGDRPAFERFLADRRVPWSESDRPPRARGFYVLARFVRGLVRPREGGQPVLARSDVLRLVRGNPLAYEGAEEWMVP